MYDLEAVVSLARDDFDAGRYDDAERTADVLIARGGPCLGDAALLRARIAVRRGEPLEALKILGTYRASFDAQQSVEAHLHLMLAHAFAGDATSAAMYSDLLGDADIPPHLRSEIAHSRIGALWAAGNVDAVAAALRRCAKHDDPRDRARHMQLTAAHLDRQNDSVGQREAIAAGLDAIEEDLEPEIAVAAALVRSLCILVRETQVAPEVAERASRLYRDLRWTPDLGPDRFVCALQLAWARALDGDRLGAVRFAHEACVHAPSPAWLVMALADRSALKRNAGETASSMLDLEEALDMADRISWMDTPDEERLALVSLAELAAAVDGPRAHALLLRSEMLKSSGDRRLAYHVNDRLRGVAQHAAGVVAHAIGDDVLAEMSLSAALAIFVRLGCAARVAQSALALHTVTGSEKWARLAIDRARAFPRSWLADAARRASSGVADESFAQLTPKQREVFRALLDGLTATRIAERVGSSPNTVRNHIHGVYRAFGVSSQPELLAEARRRRLA